MTPTSPNLSDAFYEILDLNPGGYRSLVVRGSGHTAAYARILATDPSKLITTEPKDPQMLQALAASLYLYHDWLPESHTIAQGIDTPTGAFWHAIMHRREGDFSNSKYWYARCEDHPVLQAIANQAAVLLHDLPADNRLVQLTFNGWSPTRFVDLVELHHAHPEDPFTPVLITLQQLEWRVLTEYCAALA
jgi:hypothetical protein